MDLVSSYASLFDPEIRKKGEASFRRGLVQVESSGLDRVTASVIGKDVYAAELQLTDAGLRIQCTCPAFQSRPGPCKHIWATLLAARQETLLAGSGDGRA